MATVTIIPESIKLIRLTDEQYFSELYQEYISNSKLSLINPDEGGSEDKYEQGFQSKFSDSFELGSAIHGIILQPDDYVLSNITKPSGKLGVFADKVLELENQEFVSEKDLYKQASIEADYYSGKLTGIKLEKALESCKPYWEERKKEVVTTRQVSLYLSTANLNKAQTCIKNLQKDKTAMNILYPPGLFEGVEVFNEYALFADVDVDIDGKVTRLKLKGKLDNFTVNHETRTLTLNDLKTTGKPVSFFMGNWVNVEENEEMVKKWFPGSFQTYHYYRQLGMYLWLLSCYYKLHKGFNYTLKANIVLVETFPDHRTRICKIKNSHIQQGLDEFKELLIKVVEWTQKQQKQ